MPKFRTLAISTNPKRIVKPLVEVHLLSFDEDYKIDLFIMGNSPDPEFCGIEDLLGRLNTSEQPVSINAQTILGLSGEANDLLTKFRQVSLIVYKLGPSIWEEILQDLPSVDEKIQACLHEDIENPEAVVQEFKILVKELELWAHKRYGTSFSLNGFALRVAQFKQYLIGCFGNDQFQAIAGAFNAQNGRCIVVDLIINQIQCPPTSVARGMEQDELRLAEHAASFLERQRETRGRARTTADSQPKPPVVYSGRPGSPYPVGGLASLRDAEAQEDRRRNVRSRSPVKKR